MSDELNKNEAAVTNEAGEPQDVTTVTEQESEPTSNQDGDSQNPESVGNATEPENTDAETSDDATAEESGDEPTEDAFIESLAEKCRAADAERFEGLTQRFTTDEPFAPEDIKWLSETTGYDEATVRYGISLQREAFKAAPPDTSIVDAEAEVGKLDDLLSFARDNAPADKLTEWQTVANFAKRTNDPDMTPNLLREMKQFRDSLPKASGGKPKTLGHLASSQPKAQLPVNPPEKATENAAQPDALYEQLRPLGSQALAKLVQNSNSDPAVKARAMAILKERGI